MVVLYGGLKTYSIEIPRFLVPKKSLILFSRYPVTTTSRLNPFLFRLSRSRSRIAVPLTNVRHFGSLSVSGYKRLPVPAANSSAVVTRSLRRKLFSNFLSFPRQNEGFGTGDGKEQKTVLIPIQDLWAIRCHRKLAKLRA